MTQEHKALFNEKIFNAVGKWREGSENPKETRNYFVWATKPGQGYNHRDTALYRVGEGWEFWPLTRGYKVMEWLDESPSLPTINDPGIHWVKSKNEKPKKDGIYYCRCCHESAPSYTAKFLMEFREGQWWSEDDTGIANLEWLSESPSIPTESEKDKRIELQEEWKCKIEKQIKFSNNQAVKCENDGDKSGEEAWYGYTKGLRWALENIPEKMDFVLRTENERLKNIIERIKLIQEDIGREGCTYGDTDYDSLSASFGYNVCLTNVKHIIDPLF